MRAVALALALALLLSRAAHAQSFAESPAPAAPRVHLSAEGIELRAPLRFEIEHTQLRGESLPILDEVVAVLLAHPEQGRLLIQGHMNEETWRESAVQSRVLWRERARSVRDYLVSHGVPQERLVAESMLTDAPRCDPSRVRGLRRRRACAQENNRIVFRWQRAQ